MHQQWIMQLFYIKPGSMDVGTRACNAESTRKRYNYDWEYA